MPLGATFIRASGGIVPSTGVLTWDIGNLAYTDTIQRTFVVTATQSITNTEYGARADSGYRTVLPMPVIVKIGE